MTVIIRKLTKESLFGSGYCCIRLKAEPASVGGGCKVLSFGGGVSNIRATDTHKDREEVCVIYHYDREHGQKCRFFGLSIKCYHASGIAQP